MAYGSPRNLEEVEKYYTHIKSGRSPTEEEVKSLKNRYVMIGGRSPLLEITKRQAEELEKILNDNPDVIFKVYIGMKHSHPFIKEAVADIVGNRHDRLVALPLTPHYSKMTIESYHEAVRKSVGELNSKMDIYHVGGWATNDLFIQALVERLEEKIKDLPEDTVVIFTAHSLPTKILRYEDPYPNELESTCSMVAKSLGLKGWRFSYQSASHTNEEWLGPGVLETLEVLNNEGVKNVLICPVGFVADNLEILYDIDIECKRLASSKGMELKRTESLNTSPTFIKSLASIVKGISE